MYVIRQMPNFEMLQGICQFTICLAVGRFCEKNVSKASRFAIFPPKVGGIEQISRDFTYVQHLNEAIEDSKSKCRAL